MLTEYIGNNYQGSVINCKSYIMRGTTCILSNERAKPLGRADLTDDASATYFEKKCFTCNIPLTNSHLILIDCNDYLDFSEEDMQKSTSLQSSASDDFGWVCGICS